MSATISSCLLSAGDMYYVKPYHDLNQNPPIVEDDDDDIMYKVKPISKPANLTESADLLKELENRQDAIFARLHKIQNELDKMSVGSDKKMTTTEQSSLKISFQDLVIGVDPSHIPLSLLVLYEQLSQIFKVKVSVFVHSTVKKSPMSHMQSLFKSALPAKQPDDCRTTNDLLLTFIYKQVRQDCSLMVNPERQTYIYGEVNVARYLSRLANPDYESNPVTSTQIDHWLDLASLMLWNGSGKARSQMVQNIDSALTKRKWLVGQNLSLADIVVWSGLQYAKMMDKLPSNVQAWRKNCENHPYFNLVNKLYK
ncbi:AIMP2 [Acanthosepion pharaonis]|uniref:AIMP2 n=1 Tax=Acanthosepion pharaonis TaxID=158019 RepID=A0A812AXX4_ACAPH|nr:AIMP2 [Sepia pharaonis]